MMIEVRRKGFITFEGCDGVGKTTQIKFLEEYLQKTGQPYLITREPGGDFIAEKIREILLHKEQEKMSAECEMLLFAAARAEHLQKTVLPALAEGKLVICDRYVDSSVAYQAYGRDLGLDLVLDCNRFAVETCMPEATVFINLTPKNSWRAKKGTVVADDRMESESDVFKNRVYEGFCASAAKNPDRFISVIPNIDKAVTSNMIISALKSRGIIQ